MRGAAATALAAAVGPGLPAAVGSEAQSRVILIRHADVLDEQGKIHSEILQPMLDEAVKILLEEKEASAAWRRLVTGSDVVGMKSNVWWNMPTPKELEEAVRRRVLGAGVPEKNLAIDDRGVLDNPIFKKSTALINVRPLRTQVLGPHDRAHSPAGRGVVVIHHD